MPTPPHITDHGTSAAARIPRRSDRGAALLEFSMVALLLSTLLLGIVAFGMLLSVKNSITQSANEGARHAASAFTTAVLIHPVDESKIIAEEAAIVRMRERLAHLEDDVGGPIQTQCSDSAQCPFVSNNPSITYLARVHDCDRQVEADLVNFAVDVDDPLNSDDCMFSRVVYNHEDYRILPTIPAVDTLLPETITDRADVALT